MVNLLSQQQCTPREGEEPITAINESQVSEQR